jgi:hypothetical protein
VVTQLCSKDRGNRQLGTGSREHTRGPSLVEDEDLIFMFIEICDVVFL